MVCLWTLDVGCCQSTWDGAGPALQTRATQYATTVLWSLTGRRYGPCALTVRPCSPVPERTWQTYGVWVDGMGVGGDLNPIVWNGTWRNCGCGYGACACVPAAQTWLPGPVAGISEVRVSGAVIDPTAYRVDQGHWLVRTDGELWPDAQDLGAAPDAEGSFVVTYLRGELVPEGGAAAAGALACEYIKACQGQPCRFPKRVTSVSRQGVSVSAQETVSNGGTGLPEVDVWVQAVNPSRLRSRPRVYNPDLPHPRVTTWTA